jgi:hypothetical protein
MVVSSDHWIAMKRRNAPQGQSRRPPFAALRAILLGARDQAALGGSLSNPRCSRRRISARMAFGRAVYFPAQFKCRPARVRFQQPIDLPIIQLAVEAVFSDCARANGELVVVIERRGVDGVHVRLLHADLHVSRTLFSVTAKVNKFC